VRGLAPSELACLGALVALRMQWYFSNLKVQRMLVSFAGHLEWSQEPPSIPD